MRRGTLGNFGQEVHLAHRVTRVALKQQKTSIFLSDQLKFDLDLSSVYG
jgi:hypothetical protein